MTEPVPGSTPVLGSATKRPWFPIEGMAMVLPQRIQRSAGQTRLDAIFLPALLLSDRPEHPSAFSHRNTTQSSTPDLDR
jgi:hypothetical protein